LLWDVEEDQILPDRWAVLVLGTLPDQWVGLAVGQTLQDLSAVLADAATAVGYCGNGCRACLRDVRVKQRAHPEDRIIHTHLAGTIRGKKSRHWMEGN